MKKRLIFCVIIAVMILASVAVSAQTFKPDVSRIGVKGDTLRFVVKNESLPQGLTSQMLEGAVMNGKMIYKADEEDKGDITVVNSEVKGFEPGGSTSVLVIASNEHLNVNNIDDGTSKYDCDLTVTMEEKKFNTRTFNVNFLRGGASTYMRFVISKEDIPNDISLNELKNCVITGTLVHNSDESLNLKLNNTVVSADVNSDNDVVLNVADSESASKDKFAVGRAYTGSLTISVPIAEEGFYIHEFNTSGVNVNFSIRNMTDKIHNDMWVILAAYNGTELVDVKTKTVSVSAYSASEKLEFAFEPTKPWTYGKIMIFEEMATIRPVTGAAYFNYTDPDFAVPDAGGENYGSISDTDWRLEEFYENEANVRLGIPNVYSKLEKGEPINIVFLGGSVTQGYTWCESVL